MKSKITLFDVNIMFTKKNYLDKITFHSQEVSSEIVRSTVCKYGFALLRGFLQRDFALRCYALAEKRFRDSDRQEVWQKYQQTRLKPSYMESMEYSTGNLSILDSENAKNSYLHRFAKTSGIKVFHKILGKDNWVISIPESPVLRVLPPSSSLVRKTTDFHQDACVTKSPSVLIWAALCDCGEMAPGLQLVLENPRRPLRLFLEEGKKTKRKNAFVHIHFGPKKIVKPIFFAGDAIVFSEFSIHATFVKKNMVKPRIGVKVTATLRENISQFAHDKFITFDSKTGEYGYDVS